MNDFAIYLAGYSAMGSAVIAWLIGMFYRIRFSHCLFGALLLWIGIAGSVSAYKMANEVISAGTVLLLCGVVYFWVLIRYFRNSAS